MFKGVLISIAFFLSLLSAKVWAQSLVGTAGIYYPQTKTLPGDSTQSLNNLLQGSLEYPEVSSDPQSASLRINLKIENSLSQTPSNVFRPTFFRLSVSLSPSGPLTKLLGRVVLWSPFHRTQAGWRPFKDDFFPLNVQGSYIVLSDFQVYESSNAFPTSLDLNQLIQNAGGIEPEEVANIFFEDPRFSNEDPRRFKRIIRTFPANGLFFESPEKGLEGLNYAHRVLIPELGENIISVFSSVVFSKIQGNKFNRKIRFNSPNHGSLELIMRGRKILDTWEGPDSWKQQKFEHLVMDEIIIQSKDNKKVPVAIYSSFKLPFEYPGEPQVVAQSILNQTFTSLSLTPQDPVGPMKWSEDQIQYYRVYFLKLGDEIYTMASFRQGWANPLYDPKPQLFPY